jgi:hypothetical protein
MCFDVKKIINFIAGYEVGRLAIKNPFLDVTRDGEKGSMGCWTTEIRAQKPD